MTDIDVNDLYNILMKIQKLFGYNEYDKCLMTLIKVDIKSFDDVKNVLYECLGEKYVYMELVEK